MLRIALAPVLLLLLHLPAGADVQRATFQSGGAYMVVEALDDHLLHFELAMLAAGPPQADGPLYTSPMVHRTNYDGPDELAIDGTRIETSALRVEVDPDNLCVRLHDKGAGRYLTTLCPADLQKPFKGLNIDPTAIEHAYGLGQEFKNLGSADGDWTALGQRRGLDLLGNGFQGFQNAAVGNVQIPVLYTVGEGRNFALVLDNVYKQSWDFTRFWWEARMFGDHLRFFVIAGADLPELRARFMDLTGRPPVPPRKTFGLWVSEFGYNTWGEIDVLAQGLRAAAIPVDGFVLDLNWFGGVALDDPARSEMGRLDWDQDQEPRLQLNPYFFPDPEARVRAYAEDDLGLVVIEESYISNTTPTFGEMPPDLTAFRRTDGRCDPDEQGRPVTDVTGFWGIGRMIDWTDPAAGAWIHAERRFPNLSRLGVTAHWTDLGEPESFDRAACYEGVETTAQGRKNEHADIHNLYNLMWNRAIWAGYHDRRDEANALGEVNPRPFIVTRSGAAGIQRYGAAMWSGDIAANLDSLATHMNAQMHMSFSGIDYYGSDIGGFRREVMPYNDRAGSYRGYQDELYTQWLANGAWFDVPVRPHTDNEFVAAEPPYATAPHLVGSLASNRANLRQRYELIPYYYSLAHRAHLHGEPVVPPLVFYHQDDPLTRRIGHQKLIGRDLMVAIVARHGEYERDVYLPAGRWTNYHTNEWIDSDGRVLANVPVYRDGLFRLPTFARAGAIIPKMAVDEQTKDAFGTRMDGEARDALVLRVYADAAPSRFTVYEDDGRTLNYDDAGRPSYHHRTIEVRQRLSGDEAIVEIAAAVEVNGDGPFDGAPSERATAVELVVDGAEASSVSLDGAALPERASRAAFDAAEDGWLNAGKNLVLAKSAARCVYDDATFSFALRPAEPTTSVNFVCDRGFTVPGESVYVAGSLPELGAWDPAAAIRLEPSIYHEYIYSPPPGHHGPGPSAPVWTGVVTGLPPATDLEWKCLRRREDGTGIAAWQPGANNRHRTTAAGYAGRSYGAF